MVLRSDGPVRSNRQLGSQAEDLPFSQSLLQSSIIVFIRRLSSSCARVCVCVCVCVSARVHVSVCVCARARARGCLCVLYSYYIIVYYVKGIYECVYC